ncbi:MAG: nucleotidyltransferase domain-containing protein [Myxococcota bacterium]|nr:nucleotidyltransferase domain-containing protein [Myxococcota bacterium]
MRRISDADLGRVGAAVRDDPAVVLAYVHGSALRSDREADDLDVALLIEDEAMGDPVPPVERAARAIRRETGIEPVDVRLLNLAPVDFRFHVVAAGRCVAARDPVRRVRFEAATAGEYQEFRPLLEEYQAALRRRARREAMRWSTETDSTGNSNS